MIDSHAETTIFCAVWSQDPDRIERLRGHLACLEAQTVPVSPIYVFDQDDSPPDWLRGTVLTTPLDLTIYQAWNIAIQHAETPFVMNLNLDDRLAPDAIEYMLNFMGANDVGMVAGDWNVCYSQPEADEVERVYLATKLPIERNWPPPPGTPSRLGSGTGERKTYGPATLWRRSLHEQRPYPWKFTSGQLIRSVGDLAWWLAAYHELGAGVVRLPLILGNYMSRPSEQAEFRGEDENQLLEREGVLHDWHPLDQVNVLRRQA